MNQIEVQIMGHSYRLGCPPGGEARLLLAVARVDEAMCRIRDAGKIKARDRIAVLAALNLAFDVVDPARNDSAAATPPTSEAPPAGGQADAGTGANAHTNDQTHARDHTEADPAAESAAQKAHADDLARVAHILARLDQALAQDGRLL